MNKLELTLAILKPHIVQNLISAEKIKNIILTSQFKIVKSKRETISLKQAEQFYDEHKDKFFYNRLVTLMTSGPSDMMILAKYNAIREWRTIMGPTKVIKAQFEAPHSLRAIFGLSDTRNATHGSDSPESAKREIGILYPEFDYDKWFLEDEKHFRNNQIHFSPLTFVHRVNYNI